jgi:hypothetical protein
MRPTLRRRVAAWATQRNAGRIRQVNFTIDTQPRRLIYRTPPSGAPVLVRCGAHGGLDDQDAAEGMLANLTSQPGVVDYCGQALMFSGFAHWLFDESPETPPSGCDFHTDYRYWDAVIADATMRYPGLPIVFIGYSAGAAFVMSWLNHVGINAGIDGLAIVKYTPLTTWLTGVPTVFNAAGAIPPVFLWLSNGDTVAPQTLPNVDFPTTKAVWEETKASGIVPSVANKGPTGSTGAYQLSSYTGNNLRVGIEVAGTHNWAGGVPGDIID